MFDLLIENGFVVDGSGQPGFTGDVGIANDRVVAMGDLGDSEARRTIDDDGTLLRCAENTPHPSHVAPI